MWRNVIWKLCPRIWLQLEMNRRATGHTRRTQTALCGMRDQGGCGITSAFTFSCGVVSVAAPVGKLLDFRAVATPFAFSFVFLSAPSCFLAKLIRLLGPAGKIKILVSWICLHDCVSFCWKASKAKQETGFESLRRPPVYTHLYLQYVFIPFFLMKVFLHHFHRTKCFVSFLWLSFILTP